MTAEFPRARLRLVQYLHETLGFDVLALEGSLTQAWLAQEYLYRSSEPVARRVERAQQLAWFKLWNTVEMRQLMAYVDAARATPASDPEPPSHLHGTRCAGDVGARRRLHFLRSP